MIPGFGEGPFSPLPAETVAFLSKYTKKMKEGLECGSRVDRCSSGRRAEAPLPELSRREDWKKLYPNAIKRLGKENLEFLESGALGKRYASLSEQLFAVEQALLKLLKPPQAFQILISAEGSYGVAMEHRENNDRRALEFCGQTCSGRQSRRRSTK
jgi:hypothetical protein